MKIKDFKAPKSLPQLDTTKNTVMSLQLFTNLEFHTNYKEKYEQVMSIRFPTNFKVNFKVNLINLAWTILQITKGHRGFSSRGHRLCLIKKQQKNNITYS